MSAVRGRVPHLVPDERQCSVSWQDRAACRTVDPELFFPVGTAGPARLQVQKAQRICAGCPVREVCLEYALDIGESAGVWGGASEEERRSLKRRRSRRQAAAARADATSGGPAESRARERSVTRPAR
ncbi:WhiB family transcriptional regulator [Actinacidiphila alni]